MSGQGRPICKLALDRKLFAQFSSELIALRLCALVICCFFLHSLVFTSFSKADELEAPNIQASQSLPAESVVPSAELSRQVNVQIAWGGTTAEPWRGSIELSDGQFSNMRLLGLDADQPGSFVALPDKRRILISPRFPNRYSGLELTASGDLDDTIKVEIWKGTEKPRPLIISLGDLQAGKGQTVQLEDGQSLRMARSAGDELQVRFHRDSLVFTPGEEARIDVVANVLGEKPNSTLQARFRLRAADRDVAEGHDLTDFWTRDDPHLWTETEQLVVDNTGTAPPLRNVAIPIPSEEGVYDLLIDVERSSLISTLPPRPPIAQRKIQFVVVNTRKPPSNLGGGQPTLVDEFNPADRKWQLPQLNLRPRTWSNVPPQKPWRHRNAAWTRLATGGWIAYPLPNSIANVPHMLDIELPPEYPQNIAISIMERNGDGELVPISLDSGVIVGDPDLTLPNVSMPSAVTRHQLVFWPRTTSPIVLIANRQASGDIAFGRLRLEVFKQGLPSASPAPNHLQQSHRKRFATIDRPTLRRVFLAPDAIDRSDPKSKFGFDDWLSYFRAANRLIAYLRFAGYDGVTVSIASEGSSLFPSKHLLPTPKHDRGVYANSAQDPFRKDVVEMFLKMFDREGLQFIPSLEFSTPLPELEQQLARERDQPGISQGIELMSTLGQRGSEIATTKRGEMPYYNPLDTRVQTAINNVINEVLDRYGKHESFAGLNLSLSPNTFTQLPDITWPFDDRSQQQFSDQLNSESTDELTVAEGDAQPLRSQIQQAMTKAPSPLVERWLQWRSDQLTEFYRGIGDRVQNQTGHPLYLSTARLSKSMPWQRHLRPSLPQSNTVHLAMLDLGIDVPAIANDPNIRVLHPYHIAPLSELRSQAVNLRVADDEVQDYFQHANSAAHFVFDSESWNVPDFAELGPFESAARIHTQFSPSGSEARQPFAASLATHDDRILFEGGQAIVMGQEHATRAYFEVFRQLPDIAFDDVELEGATPVVVRTATTEDDERYFYFVNSSPWIARSLVEWTAPKGSSVVALGTQEFNPRTRIGQDESNATTVAVTVEPYGLVAFRFDHADVRLTACRTELGVLGVFEQLSEQYHQIASRTEQLSPYQGTEAEANFLVMNEGSHAKLLVDSSFEQPLNSGGWNAASGDGSSVLLDSEQPATGLTSVHMEAVRAKASVTSNVFDAPATRRLLMAVKLRTSTADATIPLRCQLLTSDPNYQPYADLSQEQMTTSFRTFLLPFSDVPGDPNLKMKLKLELIGPGEVWIDDIQLYDKWFHKNERKELQRLLYLAASQLGKGDMVSCYEELSGYWPRFLLRHVPPIKVATRTQTSQPQTSRPQTSRPQSKTSKFMDGMKRLVNPFRF